MKNISFLFVIIFLASCSNDAPKPEQPISYAKAVTGSTKFGLKQSNGDSIVVTYTPSSYTASKLDTVWVIKSGVVVMPPDTIIVTPPPTTERQGIVLDANFEGSNPFSGLLDEKQYCCSYSITQGVIAHEGTGSFRAEVRKSDPSVSSGYRAELTKKSLSMTGDMWFGMSLYFETPVNSSGNWTGGYGGHFIQWHPSNSSGSASLAAWGSDGVWDICINPSGSGSVTHQSKVYTGGGSLWKIKANKWYDLVWHVNWNTGLVDVWIDGTLYAHYTGLNFNPSTYWKLGPNRWNMSNNWVIYYDNVRVARSTNNYTVQFKDVAPEGAAIPK